MNYSNAFNINSSKILLGTAYFGDTISKEDAFNIMDKYVSLGGNHIDTARLYVDGRAEEIIKEWFLSRKPKDVFVSTKGAFPAKETPDVSRLSEKEIRFDLEASLKALGTECVNFYWLHRDDENIPAGEIVETMNKLVNEGKILHFGASNWRYYRVKEANDYAIAHSLKGFEAVQIRFSPAIIAPNGTADRTLVDMDKESFSYYGDVKMPVAAYASQAKGFFSKMASIGVDGLSVKSRERYLCDENLRRLKYIEELSKKYDTSIAAIVCSALCSLNEPDTFPIIGGSRVEQIIDSMQGANITLEKEELDKIFVF